MTVPVCSECIWNENACLMEQGNSGVGAWNHRVQLAQFGFAVEWGRTGTCWTYTKWVCEYVCACVCVKEVAQTLKLTNLVRTRVQEKPLNWPKSDSEHQNFALGPFLQRCSWSLIWPSLSDSGRGTAAFGPSLHTSVQYQDVKTYQDVIKTYQDVSRRIKTYQDVSRRIKTYQDVPGYQVTLCSQHYSTSQSLRCFWVNKAGEGMSRGNSYFPVKNIHRVLFYYKTGTSTNWRELVNVDVSWAPECLEVWPFENIQCS